MVLKDKRNKIIEYARELFCVVDSSGKRVYSFEDITIKIFQKFNKKYSKPTIKKWSVDFNFDKTFEEIKKEAVKKAIKSESGKIEDIIQKQSEILAKEFKNADNLANIGYKIFFDYYQNKEHDYIDEKTAIQAIKLGTDIKHRIMSIPELIGKDSDATIIVENGNIRIM